MTDIKVHYDSDNHNAYKVVVLDGNNTAAFRVDHGSATVKATNCTGTFLQEAFDHVRELPFVQAVEEL